jgi:queuosine precursor transporter
MNSFIFFGHVTCIFWFGVCALRMGKETLIGWVALQAVLANVFVLKQITLFGLTVTCSDALAIGSFFGLNLLQEYYGRQESIKAIMVSFFCMVFFALMSQIHLVYEPSHQDHTQSAFTTLFSSSPRLLGASLATFLLVQQIDLRLFRRLSFLGSFSFKNTVSLVVSQFFDTVLFSLLGLYGLVSSIFDIIIMSFLVKLMIIFCLKPFTIYLGKSRVQI